MSSAFQFRGERFHLDLSDDDDDHQDADTAQQQAAFKRQPPSEPSLSFVKDVLERAPARPPAAPTPNPHSTGFPAHKKRVAQSRFKSQRQAPPQDSSTPASVLHTSTPPPTPPPPSSDEVPPRDDESREARDRREIDQQNTKTLAGMSDDEISKEREELMQGLSPAMLSRLLKRSTIDDPTTNASWDQEVPSSRSTRNEKPVKKVAFVEAEPQSRELEPTHANHDTRKSSSTLRTDDQNEPSPPPPPPSDVSNSLPTSIHFPQPPPSPSDISNSLPTTSIHFPHPPTPPDLDPSSSTFLTDLHTKYFPSLPSDPSKLAWTRDPDLSASESPYSPALPALAVSDLRFDFRGALITPRAARDIPVTAGLHHHGDAPEAAGYTIPELAHLSRSSVPGQRCIAFQTLGRVLYRLGVGEWGDADESMVRGLWRCLGEGRVLDTLHEEAGREGGHMSVKAYAVEALWNWQRGGGGGGGEMLDAE